VAGRAMGRFLGPQSVGGPVRWPAQPASGPTYINASQEYIAQQAYQPKENNASQRKLMATTHSPSELRAGAARAAAGPWPDPVKTRPEWPVARQNGPRTGPWAEVAARSPVWFGPSGLWPDAARSGPARFGRAGHRRDGPARWPYIQWTNRNPQAAVQCSARSSEHFTSRLLAALSPSRLGLFLTCASLSPPNWHYYTYSYANSLDCEMF
jgi:hypothetical protein